METVTHPLPQQFDGLSFCRQVFREDHSVLSKQLADCSSTGRKIEDLLCFAEDSDRFGDPRNTNALSQILKHTLQNLRAKEGYLRNFFEAVERNTATEEKIRKEQRALRDREHAARKARRAHLRKEKEVERLRACFANIKPTEHLTVCAVSGSVEAGTTISDVKVVGYQFNLITARPDDPESDSDEE